MKNVNTSLIKRTSRYKANKTNVATYRPGRGGFTLVELLVVVLIIGVLSSVALPQYTKAVNKSKVAGYWPTLKNLAEAAKLCALEKGSTCNLDELDIEAPTCKPLERNMSCSYSVYGGGVSVNFSGLTEKRPMALGIDFERGRYCVDSDSGCKNYGLGNSTHSGTTAEYLDSTSI